MNTIDETKQEGVLKSLLLTKEPFVTVEKLDLIAKECGVPYTQVVSIVNSCRTNHDEIRKCLFAIAKKYRPDILKEISQ